MKLGRRLDCDPKTIYRWECDAYHPNAEELRQMAHACGVRAEWLLTGDGEREATAA